MSQNGGDCVQKINVKNMGPVKSISVDPLKGGGIIVFVGGQGTGKSTILAAVTKRLSGQDTAIDLQPRDGTTVGELWIGSAKLTVRRGQKRNTGELEVAHIEGRFNISHLVDPGIKDPIAADQARIKALAVLSGLTAKPSDFYDAVGGQEAFDELGVDPDTSDPIVLAGRTSRALQANARKCEKKSTAEFAASKAKSDEAAKVDMTRESDGIVLQSAYVGALSLVAELKTKQLQFETQQTAIATASKSLEDLEPPGVSIEEATKALSDQEFSLAAARKEMDKARADLARATVDEGLRQNSAIQAKQVLELVQTHATTVAAIKEVIASAQLEPVSDDTSAAAEKARQEASSAIEVGVAVRQAKAIAVEALEHQKWAEASQKHAETLRDQSRAVDEILSGLIPAGNLRIDEGRIVTTTDRGSELFSELSDGERARLAIEVAVPQLPKEGLLIAPQWMWEGWTKSTQEAVWAKLKEHGVEMLTAEARDGELAVEVFEGTKKGE